MLNDIESITSTFEVMALTGHQFALGLPDLLLESVLLTANPRQVRNDRQAYGFIVKSAWRGYSYSTARWVVRCSRGRCWVWFFQGLRPRRSQEG